MTTSSPFLPTKAIASLVLALSSTTAMAAVGDGFWHTDGGTLRDAAGNVVHFSGTNWNGMDSPNLVPHRLWGGTNHTIEKHLDEMKAAGLNLIRLPFSSEIFIPGRKPDQSAIDSTVNADLLGKTCLEILDRIVASAGQRGIRIILDYHRRVAGSASEDGLWYDSAHPDAQWIANWVALVGRYKNDPTVVGGDLFNEVHASVTWNADNVDVEHNWRWALKRCGNAILAVNPHFLVCAQGLDQYKGEGAWWGEVHTGETDFPLTLDVPNQLLYEIHDYGPVVWDQPFHQVSAGFPGNLPGFWDHMWGHLFKNGTGPVWVGEWGSFLNVADATAAFPGNTSIPDRATREVNGWFPALRQYIHDNQLSWTWWTWTNDSGDTGGLLKEDNTINTAKVAMISSVTYPGFAPSGPITSTSNDPPIAVMTATPASGSAPLVVAFDASGSSDPDHDALTFAWTFGDGSAAATGATPSHTYAAAGSFTATVTVSDGQGHNVPATRSITVSSPGGGGGGGTSTPFSGSAITLPGSIEAEDFDNGGEGVAYHDSDAINNGGAGRTSDGVDVETVAGVTDIGWTTTGEWLKYHVTVASTGSYTLGFRVASLGGSGSIHLEDETGQHLGGPIAVTDTGGWQTWTTVSTTATLGAGGHVYTVVFDAVTGGANLDKITVAAAATGGGGGGGGTGGGTGATSGSQGGGSGCGSGFAVALGLVMAFLGLRLRTTTE